MADDRFDRGGSRSERKGLKVIAHDRRPSRVPFYLAGMATLVMLTMVAFGPYANYLWYLHDAGYPEVFNIEYSTRGSLFIIGFIIAVLVLYASLRKALSLSLVYLDSPSTMGQAMISSGMHFVQTSGTTVLKAIAPLLGLMFASGLAAEWNTVLLARNHQAFGMTDPIFNRDLGFFVFTLPWLRAVSNFAFGLLLFTTLATLGIYVGMQVAAALARIELSRPQIVRHLSLLIGLTVTAFGFQLYLKQFEFGLVDSGQFTGAGYAAAWELGVRRIVVWLVVAVGLVIVASGWLRASLKPVGVLVAATAAVFLVGTALIPSIIQRVYVEPNKVAVEAPYAERAIKMTRFAYGLDQVQVKDFAVRDRPTAPELREASGTLEKMRLWDPFVLERSIEAIQGFKPYYTFNDVDVDRYTINGRRQVVMLSPRDIQLEGLSPNAQSWVNLRLQYTHGYGLVMSPVDTATTQGQPTFFIRDMPVKTTGDIVVTQPRTYFSDFRDASGRIKDDYAIVSSKTAEFDYPSQDKSETHRYEGKRGIPIGSPLLRMVFASVLADGNLLVSPNITPESRLLMHRNVLDRAARIYPSLLFDSDPYIVVLDGRIVWVLDAYTVSGSIPYSAMTAAGRPFNYIRNSVKVTIDAYTGETRGYVMLPDEPVLKAYRKIYPRLFLDRSELPAGLNDHLRYPEDMFTVQAEQLTQYHVLDPTLFLTNGDAWQIPENRGLTGDRRQLEPYYVQMKLPDAKDEDFLLILPFTPLRKGNMSGWLAGHCDPDRYGRLTLYKFTSGTLVSGPAQMEAFFAQNAEIADINRQLNNEQSQILVGNLLVIPIGGSVMYVEPLYLQSRTAGIQPIPELKKVILAFEGRVVVGDTYRQALAKLLGEAPPEIEQPGGRSDADRPPTGAATPGVQEALTLLDQSEQALRAGDFARYGELQKQLRAKLRQLAGR